ncbi:hypothetical protein HDU79_005618 [Rhizoclosmatium sp. JEL0117]|nr:hypothetical protein HDU79_005618 [Rhizoclosmatium sp. JEL0117]
MFELESKVTTPFHGPVSVYKHSQTGLRVVFATLPGPLVSAQIVVATGAANDAGLAHTLEHLVFCGSKEHPRRGFLDTLATRSLSTGSNAYTADDHTSYSIVTAGAEGLARVLPVLLDHVLHPTLSDDQFMMEVYHVDGHGSEQGVVFCEMGGREHTEADLIDLRVRQALFPGTAYAFECGGKTAAIRNLTNSDIKNYHSRFYYPDNMTILICGTTEPTLIFKALESVDLSAPIPSKPDTPIEFTTAMDFTPSSFADTVTFPSQDESQGSMVFAWHGPLSSDFRKIVALDIVLRFLQDSSASPLYQTFVETDEPWAAEVDYDIKTYLQTAIVIYFSGVKCEDEDKAGETDDHMDVQSDDGDHEWDDEDDEDGDDDDEEDDDEDDNMVAVEPAVFKAKLMTLLESYTNPSSISREDLVRTIERYTRKIKEAFEEDPHEVVANYVMPDITRFHLSNSLQGRGTENAFQDPVMTLTRGSVFRIIDDLLNEPIEFWCDLIKTWFLDQPVFQLTAKPSRALAADLAAQEAQALAQRKETLGKEGLDKMGILAANAFEANKVNIPDSVLATFPSIPNPATLPKLTCEMSIHDVSSSPEKLRRPFTQAQIITTETLFTHIRLAFNISTIPSKLRPYLVLFQELLFQSPVALPSTKKEIDYRSVIKKTTETFVSHESAVGFGNDMWSCTWLAEMYMISVTADPSLFSNAMDWILHVLLYTRFTKERVLSAIQKLSSDLCDVKRDGGCLVAAVSNRLTGARKKGHASGDCENLLGMSIFTQEGFLKALGRKCKTGGVKGVKSVIESLEALRNAVVMGAKVVEPGFVQIGVPISGTEGGEALLGQFLTKWDKEISSFCGVNKVRPQSAGKGEVGTAFPLPRVPFDVSLLDTTKFGNGVVVPVEGVTASYMSIVVPCDVLKTKDYYAVALLAELLSRAEGPLYTSIRGKGYAYDASVTLAAWSSHLTFDLSESSDPHRAVLEFYKILHSLNTETGFSEIASAFNIETARASVMYRVVTEKSTGGGCIGSTLRRCLRGFVTEEQENEFQRSLLDVTAADLKRVYVQYYRQFFEPTQRLAVLITKTQKEDAVDLMCKNFKESPVGIELKHVKKLSEFNL